MDLKDSTSIPKSVLITPKIMLLHSYKPVTAVFPILHRSLYIFRSSYYAMNKRKPSLLFKQYKWNGIYSRVDDRETSRCLLFTIILLVFYLFWTEHTRVGCTNPVLWFRNRFGIQLTRNMQTYELSGNTKAARHRTA